MFLNDKHNIEMWSTFKNEHCKNLKTVKFVYKCIEIRFKIYVGNNSEILTGNENSVNIINVYE